MRFVVDDVFIHRQHFFPRNIWWIAHNDIGLRKIFSQDIVDKKFDLGIKSQAVFVSDIDCGAADIRGDYCCSVQFTS